MPVGIRLIASVIALVASVAAAQAADLPSRAVPAIPPAPVFTWTGFYIGGYVGGHFSETRAVSIPGTSAFRTDQTGLTAGGLVGANYQINQFVLGVEADGGYTDYQRSGTLTDNNGQLATFRQRADYNGHVRGRLGYAIGSFGFGETLLYLAGGGAFLNDHLTLGGSAPADQVGKALAGYTAGGGIEVAITNNVVVRGEYLYDDYGRSTYPFGTSGPGSFQNRSVEITDSTARAALEYKF